MLVGCDNFLLKNFMMTIIMMRICVPVKLWDAAGVHQGEDAFGDAGSRIFSHLGRHIAVDTRRHGRVTAAADHDIDTDAEQIQTAVTLDGPWWRWRHDMQLVSRWHKSTDDNVTLSATSPVSAYKHACNSLSVTGLLRLTDLWICLR